MSNERKKAESLREAISSLIKCPKCGHSNAMGERYCQHCGANLSRVTATAPEAPPEKKKGFFARLFGKGSKRAA